MPTIEFSLKDLNSLIGKDLTVEQVDMLSEFAKAEFEGYDKETDVLTLSCGDTNLPYLWSVEGIARLFKGVLGIEKGIPKLPVSDSSDKIIVDKSISGVRPYIAAFSARGKKIDEYILKQVIQLQEKLCESYGRRRRKVAIGVYPYDKISFPVTYRTTLPDGIRFTPLEFSKQLTPAEILEKHPTGQKYAFALAGLKEYPILVDSNNKVLSFPPIINSNDLGKVTEGTDNLFIELTGTDPDSLNLCCNIFAYALADRGYEISKVDIGYPDKQTSTPDLKTEIISITQDQVTEVLGVELSERQTKDLLEKARFNFDTYKVEVPPFRQDILHPIDIVEDVCIMYGYDNVPVSPIESHTVGDVDPLIHFADKIRNFLVGLGYIEVLSPMLTNKELLYPKMNIEDFGTIEIKEYMSENYSVVRSWILPMLLDVLSKNKHHEYPQCIYESGLVVVKKKEKVADHKRVAAVYCGPDADYTKARQIIDLILNSLDIEYTLEEVEHDSFIPGRVARVFVAGKGIAFVGEIHPKVLENFDIQMPAAGFELNISELFKLKKR